MRLLYTIIYIISLSALIFILGRLYPRRLIFENRFPFNSFSFEKDGTVYNKLKIMKWKTKIPDASIILNKLFPWLIPKKRIENADKVSVLIKETCIAEVTHAFAGILGFGCVFIWRGIGGWIMSTLFLLFNIPYVIMQRYNRPRLKKADEMLQRRASADRAEQNDSES